jgi:hypothetical protein
MATSVVPASRITGQVVRAAAAAARHGTVRAATDAALRRLGSASRDGERHPLAPAAVRVERARSRRNGERADQTAVTVWFGQGPSLPVPGGGDAMRSAVRIGTGVLGAVALAAMTAIAARREEARARVVDAPARAVAGNGADAALSR